MWLIWALLIGFLVGLVARFIMPGRDRLGFLMTSVLGIAGAMVAAVIGRTLNFYAPGEPVGFIAAVVGAIIVLAIYRGMKK